MELAPRPCWVLGTGFVLLLSFSGGLGVLSLLCQKVLVVPRAAEMKLLVCQDSSHPLHELSFFYLIFFVM